ncbi:hemolysin [Terribacillus saccharophilus]|jgi:putative hemolysin|uniref:Hemolysin n=1 Tax=Terribacillus saccharophilus TaxID=361277 RepID=A0A268HHV6_9BACI|nr:MULTISPECIES: hemolysin family protein [Terribacillus]PAD35129.1 hemolysin [Terribacillus saccharophilus]PAD95878.1 hemolysin [Terribacillus saccharophilus]PAD99798.1 hemolysin [Terribacillus saccharophilus]PAE09443.1 hemolysin [Terribacillus saccharophilus]VVM33220.1 Hemolysins and related proteins containing CBS domains [Terribacillus sp. AE2B 122]
MNSPDDPGSPVLLQLVLIGILTVLNAFFAAAEIALVSLNKNRISQQADEGDKKAALLQKLIADPSKFIATIQVGITLAGFFSSASAATGLANRFAGVLGDIPYAQQISVVVITILLSYVTLVFGELFPKRVALQNAEKIARFSVTPILFISKIAMPFVKFLSFSTNVLVKITRVGSDAEAEKVSREEIKLLAQTGQQEGILNADEFGMIKGVFDLDDKIAREIMTPRTDTFTLSIDTPAEELADILLEQKYSRIPVYQTDSDTIVGILNMKDYFKAVREYGFDGVRLEAILREAHFVPETKYIDDLLKELQQTHNHLAILIDEYGGFSGIVTMEDMIEEIVGDIDDEYDEIEGELTRIDDNTYMASGSLQIDEFNDFFDTDIDVPNFDTIAGFILSRIGTIPDEDADTVVEYENMLFTVESVRDNRLEKIKIELKRPHSEATV